MRAGLGRQTWEGREQDGGYKRVFEMKWSPERPPQDVEFVTPDTTLGWGQEAAKNQSKGG